MTDRFTVVRGGEACFVASRCDNAFRVSILATQHGFRNVRSKEEPGAWRQARVSSVLKAAARLDRTATAEPARTAWTSHEAPWRAAEDDGFES